jgi:cell wall-associated NlpC family hydrolase
VAGRSLFLIFLAFGARAAERQNLFEFLHAPLASDPAVESAIHERFADYGNDVVHPESAEGARAVLHVISEGQLDGAEPARIAEVAFAAYQAIHRGGDPEAVEGIALYGFQKKIPADSIAAWANGYREGVAAGVPDEVMADAIHEAMAGNWSDSNFNTVKWALVGAAKSHWDTRVYAAHLLGGMRKDPLHPGALQAKLRSQFAKGAPLPEPEYRGAFEVHATPPPPAPKVVEKQEQPSPRTSATTQWTQLERAVRSYLGTPYVWGGVSHKGIDCSGLTMSSYREVQIGLPRVSKQQWTTGAAIGRNERLREGDLVFFDTMGNGVSHVGMIVDADRHRIIHASSSHGVMEADFDGKWFQQRYLGARRVLR